MRGNAQKGMFSHFGFFRWWYLRMQARDSTSLALLTTGITAVAVIASPLSNVFLRKVQVILAMWG